MQQFCDSAGLMEPVGDKLLHDDLIFTGSQRFILRALSDASESGEDLKWRALKVTRLTQPDVPIGKLWSNTSKAGEIPDLCQV
jgi:hypothetical protein